MTERVDRLVPYGYTDTVISTFHANNASEVPNRIVSFFHPAQSFSAQPSSILTIGYCPTSRS